MNREDKFHELIESANREEKDRVWKKLEALMAELERQKGEEKKKDKKKHKKKPSD